MLIENDEQPSEPVIKLQKLSQKPNLVRFTSLVGEENETPFQECGNLSLEDAF